MGGGTQFWILDIGQRCPNLVFHKWRSFSTDQLCSCAFELSTQQNTLCVKSSDLIHSENSFEGYDVIYQRHNRDADKAEETGYIHLKLFRNGLSSCPELFQIYIFIQNKPKSMTTGKHFCPIIDTWPDQLVNSLLLQTTVLPDSRPQLESQQCIFSRTPGDISSCFCGVKSRPFFFFFQKTCGHFHQNRYLKPTHDVFWWPAMRRFVAETEAEQRHNAVTGEKLNIQPKQMLSCKSKKHLNLCVVFQKRTSDWVRVLPHSMWTFSVFSPQLISPE